MMDDSPDVSLNFYVASQTSNRRGRYRVATQGLSLYLDDLAQAFEIRDLSSGGCKLHAPAQQLAVGRLFDGELHIGTVCYLADLKFKVIRHLADSDVACVFQSVSREQELMLDKLLLEIQKRAITNQAARRKRKKTPWRNTLY